MPAYVIVEESGPGVFAEIVRAGKHVLSADEPASAGGTDSGPSPYEYLLGALGTCTTMTLRMYVQRKGWPIGRIAVELSHEQVHAKDCVDCDEKDVKLDHIKRYIRFEGDVDGAQRQRLLEIANKCPVHRTLTSRITIETDMAP